MALVAAGAMIGLGAMAAYGQVQSGKAESKYLKQQGEYNAQVYEQQAEMIQHQKKLEEYRYNRQAARIRGANVARAGGAGILLSGSPAAIMVDNETQIELDKMTGQYGLEVDRRRVQSGAEWSRWSGGVQARQAKNTGYMNAFSTLLQTGMSAATMGSGGSFASFGKGLLRRLGGV
jgi:hypothetical protein